MVCAKKRTRAANNISRSIRQRANYRVCIAVWRRLGAPLNLESECRDGGKRERESSPASAIAPYIQNAKALSHSAARHCNNEFYTFNKSISRPQSAVTWQPLRLARCIGGTWGRARFFGFAAAPDRPADEKGEPGRLYVWARVGYLWPRSPIKTKARDLFLCPACVRTLRFVLPKEINRCRRLFNSLPFRREWETGRRRR